MSIVAALAAMTAVVLAAVGAAGKTAEAKQAATTSVQLLAFNDFHGNLEPPSGSSGRIGSTNAGGIEYLATHVDRLRATNPNTIVVSAGDNIGASPLLSALFHDEPTIEALNAAGTSVASVGNHEFDEGWAELWRMQNGGCHPTDGCQDKTPFAGAKFEYLSGNVFLDPSKANKQALERIKWPYKDGREHPLLKPYTVKQVGGVKVGFIGLTLKGTPTIVTPAGITGLTFYDEAYMANYWLQNLRKQGVETVVVLLHEGGYPAATNGPNECRGISGPVLDIVSKLSPEIDVVVSGHTHQMYNCSLGGKLVTSAASFGRLLTDIDLTIDTGTGDVVAMQANNVTVTRDVAKDTAQTTILEHYKQFADAVQNKVIGSITTDITRSANAAGESALGDVIADAQLEATKAADKGNSVVAFMNPGGIRAELTFDQSSGGENAGQVTYGEAFTVQPFSNTLVVKTMTGDMIRRLLEQQFDNPSAGQQRILQVSNGFTYSYDLSKPAGQRVVAGSIRLNGQPVQASTSYRVTMNSFLATGGDSFTVFNEGTQDLGGEIDLDALVSYFSKSSPVRPGPQNRITRVG